MSPVIGCRTTRENTIRDGMARNPMIISVPTYSHLSLDSFKAFRLKFCEKGAFGPDYIKISVLELHVHEIRSDP